MARLSRANQVRAIRKEAAATFLRVGAEALDIKQLNQLMCIEKFARWHYGISDQQWEEIEAQAEQIGLSARPVE